MAMSKRALKNWKKRRAVRFYKKGMEPMDLIEPEVHNMVSLKGIRGGNCNVTACQRPGALYMNVGHGNAFYCRSCASDINAHNRGNDGFTLFPAFDAMELRRRELRRDLKDVMDVDNYADIEQDPWGSCYHFDRDKYEQNLKDELQGVDSDTDDSLRDLVDYVQTQG